MGMHITVCLVLQIANYDRQKTTTSAGERVILCSFHCRKMDYRGVQSIRGSL